MFIHIGDDYVIRSRNIISIIDYQMIDSSSIMEEMMGSVKKQGNIKGSVADAKSIIITDIYIYYSTLSVSTLKKRSSIQQMMQKIKNHSE